MGRPHIYNGVMHMIAGRRTDLRHLHPGIFREACWNNFVSILDISAGWKRYRARHLDNALRLWNAPARSPMRRWRSITRIAWLRALVYPIADRVNLLWRQRRIVREMPDGGIGKPRRHLPRFHSLPNCSRPWPGLFVRHKRHRSNFARAMAHLAMPLQNREHVFVKRRTSSRCRRLPGLQCTYKQAH